MEPALILFAIFGGVPIAAAIAAAIFGERQWRVGAIMLSLVSLLMVVNCGLSKVARGSINSESLRELSPAEYKAYMTALARAQGLVDKETPLIYGIVVSLTILALTNSRAKLKFSRSKPCNPA